jgi:hypothetical protein
MVTIEEVEGGEEVEEVEEGDTRKRRLLRFGQELKLAVIDL